MRKFITNLVLLVFCFGIFSQSFAVEDTSFYLYDSNYYISQMANYKAELNKTAKGKQYLKTADEVIARYANDEAFLTNLSQKLLYGDFSASKTINKDLQNFLNYFEAEVNLVLAKLQESKVNEILTPTISATDKKLADDKIIAFQQNFITNLENVFKNAVKPNQHKETGTVKVDFLLDEETIGKITTSVEMKNYEAIANGFDAQIKGDLDASISALLTKDNQEHKLDLTSAFDYIIKDGNVYALLQNLNITNSKNLDELQEGIDKLKEFAAKNQYIKIGNEANSMVYKTLKEALNQDKIFADAKEMAKNPIFEAYKVEGGKYFLRPTTFVCDSYKKASMNILKMGNLSSLPGISGTCTNAEYKDLLTGFGKLGDLSVQFDGEATIWRLENKGISLSLAITGRVFELTGNFKSVGMEGTLNASGNFDADGVLDNLNFALNTPFIVSNGIVKNKVVDSKTTILMNGMTLATITKTGTYSKNFIDAKIGFSMSDEGATMLALMLKKQLKISGNLNIKGDASNNQNNVNILLEVLNGSKTILRYEIDNKGQIQNNVSVPEIVAPTNVIDIEELGVY